MADVELKNISKSFGNEVAVRDLSMKIPDGSFVVLLGPTGAGKTTTLRLIAGLEKLDAGEITIGGRNVGLETPAQRNVAMVFQQYSLYPHLSVRDNLAFPLRSPILKTPENEISAKVNEVAEVLQISHKLENRATELSGGEMQRTAIARALINDPGIILADEPTGNLDSRNGQIVVELFAELNRKWNRTVMIATHSEMADSMATRTIFLKDGIINNQTCDI